MKKIYLSIIAVTFTLICFCQERGIADNKNLIVTSFGGSSIFSLKNDSTEFTWKQKFGYFVNSNLNVGMGFEYQFGSSDKYSLDVFVRHYYTPQNKFSFFTGADVKYKISDEKNIKMKAIGVSVYPGINYFISDGLAIESSIGLLSYTSEFQKNNSANTTNNLNFEMKLKTLNIGLICSF